MSDIKLSARWCPLCGTQHAVEKKARNPWTPQIKRCQIEALPELIGALEEAARIMFENLGPDMPEQSKAIIRARAALAAFGELEL